MSDKFPEEHLQHYPLLISPLPSGWSFVSLADIARDINPGFASGRHSTDGSGIPHLRPMNIDRDGNINLSVLKSVASTQGVELTAGDVLFNNTNSAELVGKTALISSREQGYTFSNHMTRLCLEAGIKAGFIARQLHFIWKSGFLRHRCTNHVNQASISSKTLANTMPLLLPPQREQERIIEKLEELLGDLDAGVAELRAAQQKLAQYRQSLFKAAMDGSLTAEWRESKRQRFGEMKDTGAQLLKRILNDRRARWETNLLNKFNEQGKSPPVGWKTKYSEPVRSIINNLPELPVGWIWTSLGCCFNVVVGATPSRKKVNYWNGNIPWVSSGEVRFSRISETKERITEDGLNNSSTQINPVGSVLLGMIGEGKTRGQVAILEIEAANNQNCAAIWVSETDVPPTYVYYWLWSRYDQTRQGSSGNNQPALNKTLVEKIPIPLPPVDELNEIVRILTASIEHVSDQEEAVNHALKQSSAQRQNILKAAFSGQLVPQDPNDEPASVLLERIRTERAAAGSGVRRGRKARGLS